MDSQIEDGQIDAQIDKADMIDGVDMMDKVDMIDKVDKIYSKYVNGLIDMIRWI